MAFSSNIFLFCFLPLSLLGYHLLRKELRNLFLLAISLLFYAWAEPKALLVLFAVILISYLGARLIASAHAADAVVLPKVLLALAIVADVGILIYFKYTNFLISTWNRVTGSCLALQDILLPVGISFFIFQSISYLVDVFRKKVPAQLNLLKVALYFSFFPKLTQGPIMRYGDMAEDLSEQKVTANDFAEGIRRFIIGLTKKLLLADMLGGVADGIFGLELSGLSTPLAWGGILAYTLQIYFDFSGYTDMAIGMGRMFGFHLSENFNYPYIATSITDFWRRWHITLSTWFKDYIYIPLGGNRRGNQYVNIFIVFLVTGIWHGAAWTFILWGILHGVIRLIELFLQKRKLLDRIPKFVRWAATMLLVMIGWVFFRADGLSGAVGFLGAMFGLNHPNAVMYRIDWFYNPKIILITAIAILASIPWKQVFPKTANRLSGTYISLIFDRVVLAAMLLLCLVLAMTSTYTSFIYFQF